MPQPLVSIIVPVYNGTKYLEDTVKTLVDQTYENFELILINDGSTDNSDALIDKLAAIDNRIKPLKKVNGGIANARNFGIKHAKGEFIAFCDQDDFWLPTKLAKQIPLFSNKKIGLVYSYSIKEFTSPNSKKITVTRNNGRGKIFNSLVLENLVPTCSVVVRKSVFDQVGLFNEKRELMGVDDWDVWLRFSLVTDFDFVEEPLAIHVFHGQNYSSNNNAMHMAELVCLKELMLFVKDNNIELRVNWSLIERSIHLKYYKDYLNESLFSLAEKALQDANTLQFSLPIFLKYNLLSVTPNALLQKLQKIKRTFNQ
ncbi:glycosyltransferase [Colwellia sp. 6M3]|jgi:glycosyltransferase involved in cell wall biosynthesis|uniref:glycosyltransferase family 2 protein n=1 Tax=Colwellia sp. 6M3 TaxID=2759849 RepID=UPI0015F60F9C|nr:glycosyltransferase [Colwellia sp. 6M3]MBA6417379.1 glycosyltransferase [Colwellia sp. 6M3]